MVELSSLDVMFLARELSRLDDGYLDRVYETSPGEFLVRVRHPQHGRLALLLHPGAFACLVEEPPETPQSPTSFATLLRKHLPGARVRRVEQQGFDRVLVFHLDIHGEPQRLILELFGKGNLLIVGRDDTIRVVQRTETFRDRTLKVGEPFKFPPARVNPVTLPRDEFDRLANAAQRDTVRFLALDLGFGGDLAEELVHRARLGKGRKPADLTDAERDTLWQAWQGILHGSPAPAVRTRDSKARVESVPLESPKFEGWLREPAATLSAAIDQARVLDTPAEEAPRDEEKERLERQIEAQSKAVEEQREEAERWNRRAQRLYEHFADAQAAHQAAAALVGSGDWSRAATSTSLDPRIVRVLPTERRVVVRIGDEDITLDPSVSLEKNASGFFDEAKRVKAKTESALAAIEEARAKLAGRERAAAPAPKPASKVRAPEKRFWFESFRWFYTSDGFLVAGGRDAASNEKLVKKHLHPGDLYFHADVHGAPSCVLKTERKTPPESTVRQAAQFAAAYSKAFAQFGSADAYYVNPEQVSKTAPTGEYVARGAFIVRGERTYVPRLPMEIAVGAIHLGKDGRPLKDGPHRRLIGGPLEAIEAWSPLRVRVTRGERKTADVVRELAARFGTSHDEVQAVLPPGTLQVADLSGEAKP